MLSAWLNLLTWLSRCSRLCVSESISGPISYMLSWLLLLLPSSSSSWGTQIIFLDALHYK